MTAPRQVLPNATYLVTRRCARREFLLEPGPTTNGLFGYVLAVAATRFGIAIHAFCVMSNHFHLVLTDPHARLPAFEQYLDSLVARALNAALGRWEAFWAPQSYSAVVLPTSADVVDKIAYVLANPVAAGLVRQGQDWGGLWSSPSSLAGGALEFERPLGFFRPDGCMPLRARLELALPPGFSTGAQAEAAVAAALAEREARAAAAAGPDTAPARAASSLPLWARRPEPRRRLNPRVASRDTRARIDALDRLVAFLEAYRAAWRARAEGAAAVFPAGTYLLRVLHGVLCQAPS